MIQRHDCKMEHALFDINLSYNLHPIISTSYFHNTQCQNKTIAKPIGIEVGDTF